MKIRSPWARRRGKALFGTPTCTPLTFHGGTVPTTGVVRGGSYTLTCDYGAVVDTILAYWGGNAFSAWSSVHLSTLLWDRGTVQLSGRDRPDLN